MSDERTPGGGPDGPDGPDGPRRDDSGGDPQGHDSFYDLSGEFDDPDHDTVRGGRSTGTPGGAAGTGSAKPPPRAHPVATRGEVLRAFLTSGPGGALAGLVAVLLVVVTLLALRGNEPGDGGQRAAPSGRTTQQPGRGTASSPGRGTGVPTGSTTGPGRSPTPSPGSGSAPSGGAPQSTAPPAAGPVGTHKGEGGGGTQGQDVRLPLSVLNNTTTGGLARQAADEFAAEGWPIVRVGNFTGRIPVTTAYYTPGHADEERAANALAAAFPRITRVLPRYEGLPPDVTGVVVVLAPDWLG